MTTDKATIAKLARQLHKAFDEGEATADALRDQIVREHGPETTLAVLDEMDRRDNFEMAEFKAQYEAEREFSDEMKRLFKACPEAKKASDVCRIMAARGDAFAQRIHTHFESRECRLQYALVDAAVELHPGWRDDGEGMLTKLDDSAPEPLELVEWLYKNHPKRAQAVEAAVGAAPI